MSHVEQRENLVLQQAIFSSCSRQVFLLANIKKLKVKKSIFLRNLNFLNFYITMFPHFRLIYKVILIYYIKKFVENLKEEE